MLEAICSCKLYRSSKHPDKILATLGKTINQELARQLTDYLDDEYKRQNQVEPIVDDFEESADPSDSESTGPAESHHSAPSGSFGGGSPLSFTPAADDSDFDFDSDDASSGDEDSVDVEGPGEPSTPTDSDVSEELDVETDVKESTNIRHKRSTSIGASITLSALTSDLNQMKGTLNNVADTTGVVRILLNENEVWIYYDDSINLNNVIDTAIERLCRAFNYLKFNRLARSDNALVFDVNLCETDHTTIFRLENEK